MLVEKRLNLIQALNIFKMNLKNPLSWLSLGFGSGLSPYAPGTMGSLLALFIYYLVFNDLLPYWINSLFFLTFIIFSFFIGLYIYPRTVEDENDPGSFVWDEFVGMWIACLPLSLIETSMTWLFISFLIFRLFDILKPLGIGSYDQKHGAFYVMIDDVLAGAYAAISVLFLLIIFG
jgi:phosphatidylglycerophosphatase A